MENPIVTVITPVYNAVSFVNACARQVADQDYRPLQHILINDGSTDGTTELLSAIMQQPVVEGLEVTIINLQQNGGVANARNAGLDAAKGKYVYFVDADDVVDSGLIRKCVEKLEGESAEIVCLDWYLALEKTKRYMRQPDIFEPKRMVEMMLRGRMRWNLWLFMFTRELWQDTGTRFIKGANIGEDMMFMIALALNARRVTQLHEALYTYKQSASSISKNITDTNLQQVSVNIAMVESLLKEKNYKADVVPEIAVLKLNTKLPLLMDFETSSYDRWNKWYPEANKFINNSNGMPTRLNLLQKAAQLRWYFVLRAYSFMVYKIVYNIT